VQVNSIGICLSESTRKSEDCMIRTGYPLQLERKADTSLKEYFVASERGVMTFGTRSRYDGRGLIESEKEAEVS
jgi:hypothetical protein